MKELQKEQARLRKRRQRDKERDIGGSVTLPVVPSVTSDQKDRFPKVPLPFGAAYYQCLAEQRGEAVKPVLARAPKDTTPAIVRAITNPIMRKKLEAVCSSLKAHNLLGEVRYGCGKDSITFNTVGEILDLTA